MKNILITGANGVLAKKLIEKFAQCPDYTVFASSRNPEMIQFKISGVEYIANPDLITTNLLEEIDIVVHCAFPRENDTKILAEAVQFYDCILLKAIESNVKGFINISSQSVYGNYREIPSREDDDVKPEDNYALTKYFCELLGCVNVEKTNTKLTNIRLGSLIGIEYPERVINRIIVNAMKSKEISINNDMNVFGFLDVDDAAEGLYKFITDTDLQNWNSIYNFGQTLDESKNFKYIAECIKDLFEKKNNIEIKLNIEQKDKADKLCFLSSKSFYDITDFEPQITLRASIEKIFNNIL